MTGTERQKIGVVIERLIKYTFLKNSSTKLKIKGTKASLNTM